MKTVILLVGPQGSGKTTYCKEKLSGYTRISQDEQGKTEHKTLYREALERGDERIVIDRINHIREQRGNYLALAKKYGYATKIIWFNYDLQVCKERVESRKMHQTVNAENVKDAHRGYTNEFRVPSKREADTLEVFGNPPYYVKVQDITEIIGNRRYLVVGDIHGCFDELKEGLEERNFNPDEDVLVSVGDLVDRGPKVRETLEYLMSLPRFYSVCGNHDDKLIRHLEGKQVKIANGLKISIDALGNSLPEHKEFRDKVLTFLRSFPYVLKIPAGYVVHAGFDPMMSPEEQHKSDCIFMRYYGGKTYFDSEQGILWYKRWTAEMPRVFWGHIPEPTGTYPPNIVGLDGGCVFGDYLKIWDSKDEIVYYVKAKDTYSISEYQVAINSSADPAVAKREEYVIAGLLRRDVTDDGVLSIYTYSDQCGFERAWDEITRKSRGHIFNVKTGECVGYPFPKFFNLGENEANSVESFDWTKPHWFYEKLDGWLGVLYRHDGKFKVSSRGSFHSIGAVWATDFIQKHDLSSLPDEVTLVFEMITPDQKIILDYGGQSSLVILAAFNRRSGIEYPREAVVKWATATNIPIVKRHDGMTLDKAFKLQKEAKGVEGFVVLFEDGRRVKIKTEWYMSLAKIAAHLSPISLWEVMKNGKIQEPFFVALPEELLPLARRYQDELEEQYNEVRIFAVDEALQHIDKYKGSPKDIGINRKELSSAANKVVFSVLKKQNDAIDHAVMDMIFPAGNNFVSIKDVLAGTTEIVDPRTNYKKPQGEPSLEH